MSSVSYRLESVADSKRMRGLITCVVLYLYIYIALLAVHANQKRFQCERPREKRVTDDSIGLLCLALLVDSKYSFITTFHIIYNLRLNTIHICIGYFISTNHDA